MKITNFCRKIEFWSSSKINFCIDLNDFLDETQYFSSTRVRSRAPGGMGISKIFRGLESLEPSLMSAVLFGRNASGAGFSGAGEAFLAADADA